MAQYCKVGFHGGSGGNQTGIGDYMQRLDAAGIPFIIKSVNNVGLVVEAAQHARQSGVAHSIVLRWSNPGVPPGPEVPDYGKSPEASAQEHWKLVKQSIQAAPEFDEFKDLIWVETFNEPRTAPDLDDPNFENMHPSDWLGWFAHYVGKLAMADGYRWAAFGMNAGTPEPEDWLRPGMVQYLTDCAANPKKLAVALHEYTFDLDKDMPSSYPQLIGRFTWLFEACDELGIAWPTTLITEGGWTYNGMPSLNRAIEDVRWLSEYIAQYPEVEGVNLWNLGGGTQWSSLPNKLQKLIKPLTEYALQVRFPDPPPKLETTPSQPETTPPSQPTAPQPVPTPVPTPPEESSAPAPAARRGQPRVQYERVYLLLPPQSGPDWVAAAADATWKKYGYTIGKSPDDAGVGDLDSKTVIVVNPDDWGEGEDGQGLKGFFAKYYPEVKYVAMEAASPDQLRQTLSANAI